MREAGQRLMRTASPADFSRVAADQMALDNAKAIEGCKAQPTKTRKLAECPVKVESSTAAAR